MNRVFGIGLLIVLAAVGAGYFYFRQLDAKIPRLTAETIAKRQAQTAAQDESLIEKRYEARVLQPPDPNRNVYFGDLHVHTALSFDSYLYGNRNSLDDAYRFAAGEPLSVKSGEMMRLSRPLDFVAMTDHAESFALHKGCASANRPQPMQEFCEQFDTPSVAFFWKLRKGGEKRPPVRPAELCESAEGCREWEDSTWTDIRTAADRYNRPGEFTAFVAYEYSPPLPEAGKVHRNIVFRNSTTPDHAVSAYDAETTLDLWRSLESNCQEPCEVLTIPHNMNKMWGVGYSGLTIDGAPYTDADWALRGRSEPLAEIFQIKGASECAVGAGAVDEECGFEQPIPICEEGQTVGCVSENSFAREGLKKGLLLQQDLGFNPLRFGIVAATDTHNSNPGDAEEWDFRGATGVVSSPAQARLAAPEANYKSYISRTPGGLAAIWAEDNTRDALFDSMLRRETYGTSGTRIRLRFFAGWDLPGELVGDTEAISKAYEHGVAMGGILGASPGADADAPRFLVWASQDPFSAPLQRIQIVKGWVEGGETHERVIDVACSDGLVPDSSGRCPDNGARVDLRSCGHSADSGSPELEVVWQDPDFDRDTPSFYYARVLENPTCRWSTYDALRLGVAPRDDVPTTIRERAWSSPIWVTP